MTDDRPPESAEIARCKPQGIHRLMPLLLVIYALGLGWLADHQIRPGLDADRYSFAESLVERGTFVVEGSSMSSVDWIQVDGRMLSGKPPVLNFVCAGFYWVLHHGLGLSFRENPGTVVRLFVWVFSLVPTLLTLVVVWRMLRRGPHLVRCTESGALAITGLLASATLLPAYATVFTNHALAMLLLTLAGSAVLLRGRGRTRAALAWAGFWATLSATVDLLPGTFFVVGLGLALLLIPSTDNLGVRFRRVGWMAVGCLGPAMLHLALNRITLGTWTLPYLIRDAFAYAGSVFADPVLGADYQQFPTYWNGLFHYVVGTRGVIWYMPLAVAGLVGSVACLRTGWTNRHRLRSVPVVWLAAGTLGAFGMTLLLVPRFSMGLAGGTYGNRHLLPAVPLVIVFLPGVWRQVQAMGWGRWAGRLVAAWSVVIAFLGVANPWAPQTISMFAPAEVAVELSARWGRQDWAEWIARHTAPNPAFGYAEYGGRLWARGHLPGALHCYRQSVRLQPERAQSWYNLGLIEGQMGRDYPAGEAFRRVTELEPKNGGAWGNYSMSLARMGRLREAHEAAMRALELNPASPTARRVREVTAKQLGLE